MGNSLSQESQCVLEAATCGDAGVLKQCIEDAPRLLDSVTLLKRRSVLHLAAKSGHPSVISAVLEPLLDAVREEYYASQARLAKEQQAAAAAAAGDAAAADQQHHQQQQHHHLADAAAPSDATQLPPPPQQQQPSGGSSRPPRPDVQLASFKRLRRTVNARDLYRRTPLIVAAKQGHLDCTKLLVDAASNLFAMDREGNTSLHYAALHGHAAVVEYLVQRSSERGLSSRFVNKRNLSGFTPLHYAVWSCRAGVVVPLLAAGADLSAANDRVFDAWVPCPIGSTPLHLAVLRASVPMALLLLQHYMLSVSAAGERAPLLDDPRHAVNLYGMNPAQLAAHRNNRQLAQLLMPTLALSRVLQVASPEATGLFSPPSLKSLAAVAVQARLAAQLDSLAALAAAEVDATAACEAADADAGNDGKADQEQQPPAAAAADEEEAQGPDCEQQPDTLDQDQRGGDGGDSDDDDEHALGGSSTKAAAGSSSSSRGKPLTRSVTQASSAWYEELCCVCWDCEVSAALQPCAHALCMDCAKQLVACSKTAGVTCPMCRAFIADFSLVPRPEAVAAGTRRQGFLLAGSGI